MEQAFAKLPTLHPRYFPALLQWVERHWLYIPHSLREASLLDISLYDHSKMTCAIATALFDALNERDVTDYRAVYMDEQKEYVDEDLFLLTTLDMSGIQDFIYSISGTSYHLYKSKNKDVVFRALWKYDSDNNAYYISGIETDHDRYERRVQQELDRTLRLSIDDWIDVSEELFS